MPKDDVTAVDAGGMTANSVDVELLKVNMITNTNQEELRDGE